MRLVQKDDSAESGCHHHGQGQDHNHGQEHGHDHCGHAQATHEHGGGHACHHGHHSSNKSAAPADPNALYTCPMHPEVQQIGPGTCPICGMALEPMAPSLDQGENPELTDFRRRLIVGLVLSVPLLVVEMGAHVFGRPAWLPGSLSQWLQLVLATPVVLWCGFPFLERCLTSLRSRNLNMFTLIGIGTAAAWIYSVIAVLLPGIFPAAVRDHEGLVALYFEPAAIIVVLVLVGQILELRARDKTGGAIRALLDLAPKTARRVSEGGSDEEIALDAVAVGDRLRVRPGEGVPVDGVIVEGSSAIDESMVTGESLPVTRRIGEAVIGGSVNQSGSFVMRAEKVGSETMLSKIVSLVASAQRSRAPIQRLADRVAGWFVPTVLAVAVIAFVAWIAWGPSPSLEFALVAAVTVLIIACPCALGLATPMSVMVGVGRGAEAGVLIRDAEALERLEKVEVLLVDKTGTLTEGKPAVTALHLLEGFEQDRVLRLAASLEQSSEHPLAKAVLTAASEAGVSLARVEDFDAPTGRGVTGKVEGSTVLLGNAALLREAGVASAPLQAFADQEAARGATAIFLAIDGRPAAVVAVSDPIKANAPDALAALAEAGIEVVMLTGDAEATAAAVAKDLGIRDYRAGVLPEGKAQAVEGYRRAGKVVAMAGDGVNDAPALAAADVGIAMGSGTDVAMESAGVTLLKGDITGIVRARRLSHATMGNIRQNLFFAFVYNALGVPLAAGVLYPFFGILLSPIVGAAAMALSSVSVIGNALRLRKVRL